MTKKQIRIVAAIKKKYPDLSQKQIKKLLDEGNFTGRSRVFRQNDWVFEDEQINLKSPFKTELLPNAQVNCVLIKKDKDYIFFDKGPFVHSVALDYDENHAAANWLLSIDPKLSQVSDPLESGLLHRLDYETSGVMVAARNRESFDELQKLFQTKKVDKLYRCLVSNLPPQKGVYTAYAGKKSGTQKRIHIQIKDSPAKKLTAVRTEILAFKKVSGGYLIDVRLITGYRHQIRAHLALLGSPIVGDSIYGGKPSKRIMLHAESLSFEDEAGKRIVVRSKMETEFQVQKKSVKTFCI